MPLLTAICGCLFSMLCIAFYTGLTMIFNLPILTDSVMGGMMIIFTVTGFIAGIILWILFE